MVDQDTFYASQLDLLAALIEQMTETNRHLSVIADYAEMLRIEKTGEKVYEVQAYVVSATSNGDRCVYLYSTHPGLQYRVCTVYKERLGDLPFSIPANAKVWDGEAAPSREGGSKKGYMLAAPQPFKVSLLPTGSTTDAGLPVHKFNRVLDTVPQPRHSIASQGPDWGKHDPFDDLPSATEDPAVQQVLAKAANGNSKRPAWQDPADHDRQVKEETAAKANFQARQSAPPAPPTNQELDRIAASDDTELARAARKMQHLAETATDQNAAAAIVKSAQGQVAKLDEERALKSVKQAIIALTGMQPKK